jgi:outer membrane protein
MPDSPRAERCSRRVIVARMAHRMRHRLLPLPFLLLLLLLSISSRGASAEPITLAKAVEIALHHHPVLAQATANQDSFEARIGRARAPLLPVIGLQANGSDYYVDTVDGTPQSPAGFTNSLTYAVQLGVTQLVTDSGLTKAQVAGAREAAREAHAQTAVNRLDIELGVVQAYLQILQGKELLAVSVGAIALVNEQLTRATALFKATLKPELDVLSAETQLAQAELQRLTDENGIEVAQLTLQNAIGANEPLVTDVLPLEIKPLDSEAQTGAELSAASLKQRPEIVGLQAAIAVAETLVDVGSKRTSPVITAQGGLLGTATYVKAASGPSESAAAAVPAVGGFALLSVTWDFYVGNGNTYEIADARAQVRSAEAQLEQESQSIALNVSGAALSVKLARESLAVATAWRGQSQRQLQVAQGRYQNGVGNFVELNDARTTLVNAQRQEITAKYNLAQSRITLARQLGRPPAGLASPQ